MNLVEEAQQSKSKTQDLANRAAFWLTLIAIKAGLITLDAWVFFTGQEFSFALNRIVAITVIICPHALGLAIPLVTTSAPYRWRPVCCSPGELY